MGGLQKSDVKIFLTDILVKFIRPYLSLGDRHHIEKNIRNLYGILVFKMCRILWRIV